MRANPEIQLKYTFGDRKVAMDGRPISDYSDFEINMKPVPKRNADDIRYIAKMYTKIMEDPSVKALRDKEQANNMYVAVGLFIALLAAIYFSG
jgi:hypothetical protein